MPFKKGDKVVVVDEKQCIIPFKMKEVYEVEDYDPNRWDHRDGAVRLLKDGKRLNGGLASWFCADRFKLAKPAVLKLEAGCVVECIDAQDSIILRNGHMYTVENIVGVTVKLEGIGQRYHQRRFAVVAVEAPAAKQEGKFPFDPEKWIPVEGEKVYVVGTDRWASSEMRRFVNNGKEYTIKHKGGHELTYQVKLEETGYYYDPRKSLRPVWAGKVDQKDAPKPPPPPPPGDLRQELWKKSQGAGGLCSFAYEFANGKQCFFQNAPCHANMNPEYWGNANQGEIVKVVYCVRHSMERKVSAKNHDAYRQWTDYIINHSPWAVAFLTKDLDEAFNEDIYMNVEVNRHVMLGGCVALRSGFEFERLPIFMKMKEEGHNLNTCFLMSCAFSRQANNTFSFAGWGGGHDVMDGGSNAEEVFRFFKEGYFKKLDEEPYRVNHGRYEIARSIAKTVGPGPSIFAWIKDNTPQVKKGEGWDKVTYINAEGLTTVANKLDAVFNNEQVKEAA